MALSFNTPFPLLTDHRRFFVGRGKELDHLAAAFSGGAQTAAITGLPGIGKTQVAYEFLAKNNALFPGGIAATHGFAWLSTDLSEDWAVQKLPSARCVILIDDADIIADSGVATLRRTLSRHQNLNLILTSRSRAPSLALGIHTLLELAPFSPLEAAALIRARCPNTSPEIISRLAALAEGNPLVIDLATGLIGSTKITWEQLFARLSGFRRPGLLGPDGHPIASGSAEEAPIIAAATQINDELLRKLRKDPEMLRKLPSRSFEELVAAILGKLGFSVSLTPMSKDGGFDIFAAKKDNVFNALFLVECKRYVPPNKVGVEIVRSLHGVVQSKKATAGILATTSFFTSCAQEFQKENQYQIQLKDYLDLQEWLQTIHC